MVTLYPNAASPNNSRPVGNRDNPNRHSYLHKTRGRATVFAGASSSAGVLVGDLFFLCLAFNLFKVVPTLEAVVKSTTPYDASPSRSDLCRNWNRCL
jgi:hypothetical protein